MEIGGEHYLDIGLLTVSDNNFFNYLSSFNCVYTDSGRSALMLLNDYLPPGDILLPDYICESVINSFSSDRRIDYYSINDDFTICENSLVEKIDSNTATVLLLHYFGSIQPLSTLNLLSDLREQFGFLIIEDTTHSIFTKKNTIGDYCIASLRKWFPIPDGGVLYSQNKFHPPIHNIKKNIDTEKAYAMVIKKMFLDKKLNSEDLYLSIFASSEMRLDSKEKPALISDLSHFLLSCNDINSLITARKSNYQKLSALLKSKSVTIAQNIEQDACPFTMPCFVETRDTLRQYLIAKRIFCAIHWPIIEINTKHNLRAEEISKRIISLPIDQRYTHREIEYLAEMVNTYPN